jgi:hypothetical protein
MHVAITGMIFCKLFRRIARKSVLIELNKVELQNGKLCDPIPYGTKLCCTYLRRNQMPLGVPSVWDPIKQEFRPVKF